MSDLIQILDAVGRSEPRAAQALFPLVYDDPRQLAARRLATENPVAARAVELRQFAGLGHEDVAAALGITVYLARQKWNYARAWLRNALGG
jgi:DNA-directed RNA polymerase specialized sigma24 family protein